MEPKILPSLSSSGIATLTLNNPDKHNAFDDQMIDHMIKHLDILMGNDNARIIILQGAGKHFCAGADLDWMKRMASASFADNRTDAAALAKLMNTLWLCTKPVVARVQGAAFGGALGLVACADIVIAASDARFCLSEVKLGLTPAVISPYVTRAIGPRAAGRYFLTAEEFNATTARELGLVHDVVSPDQLDSTVEAVCKRLSNNGPHAMRATKTLLRRVQFKVEPSAIDYTSDLIAALRVSPEGQEGMAAFFDKRPPAWTLPQDGTP